MRHSRWGGWVVTALCALPLVAAAQADAPAPGTNAPVSAVWVERQVNFTYMPLTSYYSCDGLRDKVRWIVKELGARPGFRVTSRCCTELQGPEPFPGVEITASFPAAATPELLEQLAGEAAKRQLAARATGRGFAGLMGSGRTELALSLFGNPRGYRISGEVLIGGKPGHFTHPEKAIKGGVAYVTEDRKGSGLILIQDVKQNITLANLREIARRSIIDGNIEIQVAEQYRSSLNIKTPTVEQRVGNLSGGNQKKVSLGKWLFVKPNLLILDEPTRGIDVGAKYEIYTIMTKLVQEGMRIIMISSELPEVLGMSDRVYVVSSGRITGELPIEEATQEKIMVKEVPFAEYARSSKFIGAFVTRLEP